MITKHVLLASLILTLTLAMPSVAAETKANPSVLFSNAKVFDGQNEKLIEDTSVLVEGNKISKIAQSINAPAGAIKIDAGGAC